MEDFLIPDRARIAATLRRLAAVDRGQRPRLPVNGRSQAPAPLATQPSPSGAAPATASGAEILPQASSVIEIDLSRVARRLDADRGAWQLRGVEPSFPPFFAEALLVALRQVPQANAAFDAEARGIRRYPAVHLGLSIASADGSSACHGVVRDADTRNLLGLAMEIAAIRSANQPQSLTAATITLADYGSASSALYAVPVVSPGEVAAIRIGAVGERLVVRERGFALAPTAYVCASIDHRALDGMDAGALLSAMKRFLEED
jgi:2-oxoisovalerate dehydrogenase E2 component (dihydrolipoyl transacylase)